MVLLTMTPAIVAGLQACDSHPTPSHASHDNATEPTLDEPASGKPISHQQIVELWKRLRSADDGPRKSLEELLQGSRVFIPPPQPKPEPSKEYKALMARLRREEAAREYERMVNPPPKVERFNDRYPTSAAAFAQVNRPTKFSDIGDDDVTLGEVHRQVMLIINFLVSILGVAATLWVTARWWSLPARLLLTLAGSILVAIAEVAVYSSYMWRMDQAKQKQKATKEVKEVVNSWSTGKDEDDSNTVLLRSKEDDADGTVRKRTIAPSK